MRELARRASGDPSHVSRLAASLERRGLLARLDDPSDRRRMLFRITEKGRALYEEVRPKATAVSMEFQALFTPQEVPRAGSQS